MSLRQVARLFVSSASLLAAAATAAAAEPLWDNHIQARKKALGLQ